MLFLVTKGKEKEGSVCASHDAARELLTLIFGTTNSFPHITAIAGAGSMLVNFSSRSAVIWYTSGNPVTLQSSPFISFTKPGAAVKIRAIPLSGVSLALLRRLLNLLSMMAGTDVLTRLSG
jgi:hypothetical protein